MSKSVMGYKGRKPVASVAFQQMKKFITGHTSTGSVKSMPKLNDMSEIHEEDDESSGSECSNDKGDEEEECGDTLTDIGGSSTQQAVHITEDRAQALAKPSRWWVVHPNSPGRLGWDLLSFIIIMFECLSIPLAIAFDVQPEEALFLAITSFFFLDMAMSCITGYFQDGMLIMQHSLILRNYLTGFFVIDFVSTFPWEVFSALSGDTALLKVVRFTKLARIMRLLRVMKLQALLARLEDLLPSLLLVIGLSLLKVLGFFALLCHWVACIWGFLGSPAKTGHATASDPAYDPELCERGGPCEAGIFGSPWLHRYGLDNAPHSEKYLASLVFAAGLMTGGELPMSSGYKWEHVFMVLMMVASFLLCAVILSEIVVMIQKLKEGSSAMQDKVRSMKEFMASRKVPFTLQCKIKRYLEFTHKSHSSALLGRSAFYEDLSPWLRLELTEQLNSEVMVLHPFFRELPTRAFKHMCALAQTVLYAPGDIVMQRGHRALAMVFIVQGKLKIIKRRGQKGKGSDADAILQHPSWIGDICIFKELVRTSTVRAITHVEVLTVRKDSVQTLLTDFPKMNVVYERFKKKVEASTGDCTKCENCGGQGHDLNNCPLLQEDNKEGKKDRSNKGKGYIASAPKAAPAPKAPNIVGTFKKKETHSAKGGRSCEFDSP